MQLIVAFGAVDNPQHHPCFSYGAPSNLIAPLWIGNHSYKHPFLLSAGYCLYRFLSLIGSSWDCIVSLMHPPRPPYSKIRRIQSAVEEFCSLQWKLNASTSAAVGSNSRMVCSAVCRDCAYAICLFLSSSTLILCFSRSVYNTVQFVLTFLSRSHAHGFQL